MEKLNLKVEGMTCVNCARTIERALKRLRGIKKADISFEIGAVTVEYEETLLSSEEVVKVIEDLGYKVVSDSKKKDQLNQD